MNLHQRIAARLREQLDTGADTSAPQLNEALRLLAKWRSVLIQNTVLQHHGTRIWQGPFAGMEFLPQSAEGCHIAKLLGTYEQPLHAPLEEALARGYDQIVNIGCAEGYYAVGLARRLTQARVLAFDLNPVARDTCIALAGKNGVAERVVVGSEFRTEDFASLAGTRSLVLCDIEGAEHALLDPAKAPALAQLDLIVESHECLVPGVTETLLERFGQTHTLAVVHDDGHRQVHAPPRWFCDLAHLDQLLATWEWRSGPTPWLVMQAR